LSVETTRGYSPQKISYNFFGGITVTNTQLLCPYGTNTGNTGIVNRHIRNLFPTVFSMLFVGSATNNNTSDGATFTASLGDETNDAVKVAGVQQVTVDQATGTFQDTTGRDIRATNTRIAVQYDEGDNSVLANSIAMLCEAS